MIVPGFERHIYEPQLETPDVGSIRNVAQRFVGGFLGRYFVSELVKAAAGNEAGSVFGLKPGARSQLSGYLIERTLSDLLARSPQMAPLVSRVMKEIGAAGRAARSSTSVARNVLRVANSVPLSSNLPSSAIPALTPIQISSQDARGPVLLPPPPGAYGLGGFVIPPPPNLQDE